MMEEEMARALMAMTETEAAALHLLDTIERARKAMRTALEGRGNTWDSTKSSTKVCPETSGRS